MTEERLAGYYDWAGHPDRDAQAARIVRELVREVRRLRKELTAAALDYLALEGQTWEQPAPVPPAVLASGVSEIGLALYSMYEKRFGKQREQPAPVPPFRGILAGITAADVYGVYG